MSQNPLFNGTEQETIFKARLDIPPIPPGESLRDLDALREWLETAIISIESQKKAMFSYTAGPASAASPDERDKPRFLFDEQGRYLGLALWVTAAQNWSLAGVPGELKTVSRSELTVEDDMKEKLLFGWFLCDGTSGAAPNLTANEGFFTGSTPDWDIYTVMKLV